jgi:hypothetical protein
MTTWTQFLKMVAARAPVPPPPPRRKATPHITPAQRCEEIDSGTGDAERLLPAHEILRALQLYSAPEFKRQRRVLISAVAAWSNLSRETVYQARRGTPMSRRVHVVLSRTISLIEKEGLYFKRTGQEWEAFENPPPPHTPPAASLQPSLADRKVIPVDIGGLIVNVVHGW